MSLPSSSAGSILIFWISWDVRKPSKKCMNGTRPLMVDRWATAAKSAHSWTLALQSIAQPVLRQPMTSEWSPKMDMVWVPTVRAAMCRTTGFNSPDRRCMTGIISIRPCDAVKDEQRLPVSEAPWTAPIAPASDCISTNLTGWPKRFLRPLADQTSTCSAIGDDGVIG